MGSSVVRLAIFLLILAQVSGRKRCLSPLQVQSTTNRSITISWDYKCKSEANSVLYKIYYEHIEWKACPTGHQDEDRGAGRGNIEVKDETRVVVENLHPYSLYKLMLKALPEHTAGGRTAPVIPEEEERIAETQAGVPNVRPGPSSTSTRIGATSLRFYWQAPVRSRCEHFNSQLDGYHYTLKGIETWNIREEIHASTPDVSKEFDNLQPYSNYILYVYAANAEGQYNPDLPFKIPAETLASDKAGTPRDLRVTISPDGVYHITWLPPYPPRGIVSHYSLRWKPSGSELLWSGSIRVEGSGDLCSSNALVNYTQNQYEKRICFTWSNTESGDNNQNLTFQAAAHNTGSTISSDWSASTFAVPGEDGTLNQGWTVIIAVISVVGLLFIILLATCLSFQFLKRRRQRYKNVPIYVTSNQESIVSNRSTMPPPWTPPTPSRHSSNASSTFSPPTPSSRYQHLLVQTSPQDRPASIQETPLPPVPPQDPVYEELCQDTLLRNKRKPESLNLEPIPSKGSGSDAGDDEDDFLKPTPSISAPSAEEGTDGYLTPNRIRKRSNSASEADEEYLKPTFNQFERINSRDLSPPNENPPPIPMQSYTIVKKC